MTAKNSSASRQSVPVEFNPSKPARVPRDRGVRDANAQSAFWLMTRRVTILAAAVDVALLIFFLAVNSPLLAWLNVVSIVMYGAAYALITRRKNIAALILIWAEVL